MASTEEIVDKLTTVFGGVKRLAVLYREIHGSDLRHYRIFNATTPPKPPKPPVDNSKPQPGDGT